MHHDDVINSFIFKTSANYLVKDSAQVMIHKYTYSVMKMIHGLAGT